MRKQISIISSILLTSFLIFACQQDQSNSDSTENTALKVKESSILKERIMEKLNENFDLTKEQLNQIEQIFKDIGDKTFSDRAELRKYREEITYRILKNVLTEDQREAFISYKKEKRKNASK